jgi:hypothetical protein
MSGARRPPRFVGKQPKEAAVLKCVTALVVLVAGAAAFLPSALATAAPEGSMTLTASFEPHSMAKVGGGRRGPTPGETIVFSTALEREGKPAGRGEFVQTIVDPRYRGVSTTADLLLSGGTIELQGAGLGGRPPGGAKPSRETAMAIVGGTGAYAGAGGSVDLLPVILDGTDLRRRRIRIAGLPGAITHPPGAPRARSRPTRPRPRG